MGKIDLINANDIIILAEKTKVSKKGDGINAVLSLMKDIREFKDKVDECAEAQSLSDHRQTIQDFNTNIETMYKSLLQMAEGGISSQEEGGINLEDPEAVEGVEKTINDEYESREMNPKPPIMLNTPTIPAGIL